MACTCGPATRPSAPIKYTATSTSADAATDVRRPFGRCRPRSVDWTKERSLTDGELAALRCDCGDWLRPHVLWFDESYDEPRYRYVSALRAAEAAAALIVVGTSGATTLPARMCEMVAARGAPLIVVDPEPTVFSALAERTARGLFLRGTASAVLPSLIEELSRPQA